MPMDKHFYYKNDIKLNCEWIRVYSTNNVKLAQIKINVQKAE